MQQLQLPRRPQATPSATSRCTSPTLHAFTWPPHLHIAKFSMVAVRREANLPVPLVLVLTVSRKAVCWAVVVPLWSCWLLLMSHHTAECDAGMKAASPPYLTPFASLLTAATPEHGTVCSCESSALMHPCHSIKSVKTSGLTVSRLVLLSVFINWRLIQVRIGTLQPG